MGTPRRHLPKNACVRLRSDLLNKKTPEILPFDVAQNSQYFRSFFICKSSCSSENKHFWADAFVAVYNSKTTLIRNNDISPLAKR